ncbi:MAG: hypothetical protein GY929_17970 [Actinomycetia bacterium]|nr:hypothetical protein [Actinomycetes bacterium]
MGRVVRPLMFLGAAVTVLAASKFHAAQVAPAPYDLTSSSRFAWVLTYLGLIALATYAVGLPDLTRGRRSVAKASISATALAALGISLAQLMLGAALLPRFVVFGSALVLIPWFWICANLAADGRARDEELDRVFVVGGSADAADLDLELERGAERPALIVETMESSELATPGARRRPLVELARACEATVVVLDREALGDPRLVSQVAELHEAGIRIRTLALFYEEWLGKLPVGELERVSLLFDIGELHRRRYARQRRVVDLLVGFAGSVALVLLLPVVLVGNLVANRGPLFFRQSRVGHGGRPFEILKLRTMSAGGDSVTWTTEDDPRITPFGRLLRQTHLDELPQMVNILRGDLALVGPRPEQPAYVEELREKLPFYRLRHLAKPGLTGWAQVKYGYAGSEADALQKLQYEFYYLRHQSLWLDLRVVVRTIRRVVGGLGR